MSAADEPAITYIPLSSDYSRDDCKFLAATYDKGKQLGSGFYGTVYELCRKASTDCTLVLKVTTYFKRRYEMQKEPRYSEQFLRESWEREVRILNKLNQCQKSWGFQFCPILYDSWICKEAEQTSFFIVIERFDGNLDDFMKKFKGTEAAKVAAMSSLKSLARDLKIIHNSCKICINDIKLENVLFKQTSTYTYSFIFTDMGIATDETDSACQARDTFKFTQTIEAFEKGL